MGWSWESTYYSISLIGIFKVNNSIFTYYTKCLYQLSYMSHPVIVQGVPQHRASNIYDLKFLYRSIKICIYVKKIITLLRLKNILLHQKRRNSARNLTSMILVWIYILLIKICLLWMLYITIYKKDANFWDDFFIISILPLKKLQKKN
jgi:hypothetical protein